MKYATAAYGDVMIRAAEMDVLGKFDDRLSPATRERISEHCGIPVNDIVLMDVDYAGDVSMRTLSTFSLLAVHMNVSLARSLNPIRSSSRINRTVIFVISLPSII